MNNYLTKAYSLFRLWSLDVVTGTVFTGLFIAKLLNIHPVGWWYFILASTVWIIYTIDHLLDGYKGKNSQAVIYRHRYHLHHKKMLLIMVLLLSALTLWAGIAFLHGTIVKRGIILFALIISYFLVMHLIGKKNHLFNQKEFFIALAYTSGILLAPLIWNNLPLTIHQIILIVILTLLAWAEGVMASWFDYENDLHDHHHSFATTFGKQNTRYFLIALHILIFILLKINILFTTQWPQFAAIIIEAVMNLALLMILLFPEKMKKNERYRILGEMVFWLPGLMWFMI